MSTPLSFVLCNYKALEYFRFAYESLRANLGPEHEVVLLDDGSGDGAAQWMAGLDDPNLIRHCEPENVGIAHAYNKAVSLTTREYVCVLHSDMYVPPGFDRDLLETLDQGYDFLAAYRAEPPVYDPSPDKADLDCGDRLAAFDRDRFHAWAEENRRANRGVVEPVLFFPWVTRRKFFMDIGGVDLLFLKYMVDDDDLYLRVKLSGARYGQARQAAVYHFGSRSTRFLGDRLDQEPSGEWAAQYYMSIRNFARKWGCFPGQVWNERMELVTPATLDIGLELTGATAPLIRVLEPFASALYVDSEPARAEYLATEQPLTRMDLGSRVRLLGRDTTGDHDVLVRAHGPTMTEAALKTVPRLHEVIAGMGRTDPYTVENVFRVECRRLRRLEHDRVVNARVFDHQGTGREPGFEN